MIISRTPLRVSYVGGGSDFGDYYRIKRGRVISTTIDKYIYVTIAKKFDGKLHLRYSEFECVDDVNQLKHIFVREALKLTGITKGVEIVTISDVPTTGCGLGSSSSLMVGLLNAFNAYQGHRMSQKYLANQACNLEIESLGFPIGKQDQYAASFGNLNLITFKTNGEVDVNRLFATAKKEKIKWLQDSSMLFYLGGGRLSSKILVKHKNRIRNKESVLDKQVALVERFYEWLHTDNMPNYIVGDLVNLSWKYKMEITPEATNDRINEIMDVVMQSGAYGAKVCGAGSSGFVLIICEKEKQESLRKSLSFLSELEFVFENKGAEIIYAD